jgi:hypothetical protein
MNVKDPQKIISGLVQKYAKRQDNVIYADKLFIINSIIADLFAGVDYRQVDKKVLAEYGYLIDRYLKDEVDILWKDGKIQVEELTSKEPNGV